MITKEIHMHFPSTNERSKWTYAARAFAETHTEASAHLQAAAEADELTELEYAIVKGIYWAFTSHGQFARV
jgi:hypothetical protein